MKTKIVFFCESVTLAHVARTRLLADSLSLDQYDITFYCDDYYDHLFPKPDYALKPLGSTSPTTFIEWNLKSMPIWPRKRIKEYIQKDFEIIEAEKPDLVIGDMRHTLQISAKISNIPYINIINGYWCSSRKITLPIPDVQARRILGTHLAQKAFNILKPLLMIPHTFAFNSVRRQYGLAGVQNLSLPHIFCESDYAAYLDLDEIVDMDLENQKKRTIGPVLWAPQFELPNWWNNIPTDKPIVYINLGSSGDPKLLPDLVHILAKHAITLIVGTASDNVIIPNDYTNVFSAKYTPGDKASEIADIVISNGGSPTTMQALACGVFSIGICFNIDQLVNMQALKAKGLGDYFYPSSNELVKIEKACMAQLTNKADLTRYSQLIKQNDPYAKFNRLVSDVIAAD